MYKITFIAFFFLVYTQSAVNGFISGMDTIISADTIFATTAANVNDAVNAIINDPKTKIDKPRIRKLQSLFNLFKTFKPN